MDSLKFDEQDPDIADSSLLYYNRTGDTVNVCVERFDGSQLDFYFQGVVLVHECLAGDLHELRTSNEGVHLREAVEEASGSRRAKLIEYQFVDSDERVSLRVICNANGPKVRVSKRSEHTRHRA